MYYVYWKSEDKDDSWRAALSDGSYIPYSYVNSRVVLIITIYFKQK